MSKRSKATNVLQLANLVFKRTQEEKLFNLKDDLLIMFSGGQDSALCILVLFLLKKKETFTLNHKNLLNFLRQKKKREALVNQRSKLLNNYTLVWCNHFWQESSFFTMAHVSRLTYCQAYKIYFFAPIQKVLSEQGARDWRHKKMQRSSMHIRSKKYCYKDAELCINLIFIAYPFNTPVCHATKLRANPVKAKAQAIQNPNTPKPIHAFTEYRKQREDHNFLDQSGQLCVQGHNKSDRAESILFNVIKGTGIKGLSTLQWKRAFSPLPFFLKRDQNKVFRQGSYLTNPTNMFYPTASDFFKELRIVRLQSQFVTYSKPNQTVRINRNFSAIRSYLLFLLIQEIKNSKKAKHKANHKNQFDLLTSFQFSAAIRQRLLRQGCYYYYYGYIQKSLVLGRTKVYVRALKTKFVYSFVTVSIAALQSFFLQTRSSTSTECSQGSTNANECDNENIQLRSKFFHKRSQVKSFYYLLKYKTKIKNKKI